MAQYEEKNQLDYRQGGDTVDDFAQKYMAEMTRVFRFLNDLRSNTTNSTEYTEPVANQLKVEDGKLYIRNATNTEWVLLGSVDTNFGFKPAEATFISTDDLSTEKIATINALDMTKAVTTDNLSQEKIDTINSVAIDKTVTTENLPQSKIDNINALDFDTIITTDDVVEATGTGVVGKLLKTNEDGLLNADITGNAAKLAGIRVASDIIQDGQVLTYRSATNTWTNENKGVIGSGKALNLYDGDTLLCSYVGDETRDFDLGITANKQYVIDNLASKADLASPALTGTPTAPTAEAGTNTTQIATTEFVNTKASDYLPLSGGAMTGDIYKSDTSTVLQLWGGNAWTTGAAIQLKGKDCATTGDDSKGAFVIKAQDGTNRSDLSGEPDGTLTWGYTDLAGGAVVASGTNYIRYASGLQICFGSVVLSDFSNVASVATTVTFPAAFKAYDSYIAVAVSTGGNQTYSFRFAVNPLTTTTASLLAVNNSAITVSGRSAYYLAVGLWK